MARDNYTIFNLHGEAQYINKVEDGFPLVEVHEFCCNDKKGNYIIDTVAEGSKYENDIPVLKILNFSFYCDKYRR